MGALISSLHYALQDFSLVKMKELTERHGGEKAVEAVLSDVDGQLLATGALRAILNILITVAVLLLFGAFHVEQALTAEGVERAVTVRFGWMAAAAGVAWVLIYTFGLVLPMSIAEHAGERLIRACAGFLRLIHLLAWPMRAASIIDVAVKRLAGVEHVSEAEEIEDEILSAVTEGEREGNLGETQREMIEAVVDLRSQRVEDVMTPRTEIEGLELTDDLEHIRKFIESAGHSRIPVYTGDLDHIVGVLYAKDLLRWLGRDAKDFKLKPILRRPVWVPETKPLTELLYELRARKVHMAIVLDEYGGTTGLVTFEDLLEAIVGEIQDEYEQQDESVPEIVVDAEARAADVEARAYIEDANKALAPLGIALPESEEYDTVGGWVLAMLGHIPVKDESFSAEGVDVTVLEAEPTRVARVRVALRPPETDEQEAERLEAERTVDEPAPAVFADERRDGK
jgi:putative hemolysin